MLNGWSVLLVLFLISFSLELLVIIEILFYKIDKLKIGDNYVMGAYFVWKYLYLKI